MKQYLITFLAITLICTAPVAAQETGGDSDDENSGDGTVVNIDLGEVVEAIEDLATNFDDFTKTWDEALKEILKATLFHPFLSLLKYLVSILARVLLHTPDVHPNPAIESIHRQTLLVTYLCSGIAFMTAGLLHMVGPIFGIAYRQVRMIFPRIVVALIFASVSLPLLQYTIEFSNALVHAFKPAGLETSMGEMLGTGSVLVIVWVVNSWLLLAVVIIFVIRAAYLLFVAAISPLVALGWSLPQTKRYADTFIAGWFTALMMAPLDMLALKLMFVLMSGNGATGIQHLSNWVYGMAASVLLLWIPYQLYGASQAAIGQAYSITGQTKSRWKKHKRTKRRNKRKKRRKQYWNRQERKWDEYRQERLKYLKYSSIAKNIRDGGDAE
jgi:hypothetical protein